MAACSFEPSPPFHPLPSAFFILRLICFVNVSLPSPSLGADCDSYCKASKGKLKINMKKYCKKDYGECPQGMRGAVPEPSRGPGHSPGCGCRFGNGFFRFAVMLGGAVMSCVSRECGMSTLTRGLSQHLQDTRVLQVFSSVLWVVMAPCPLSSHCAVCHSF